MRCSIAGIAGSLVGFPFGYCLGSALAVVARRLVGRAWPGLVVGEGWQVGAGILAPLLFGVLAAVLVARLETRPAPPGVAEWRLNLQRIALLLLTLPLMALHVAELAATS